MFYKAEKDMIERKDLSDSEKIILVVLGSLSQQQDYCFATNATLASLLGWSIDKTKNNLRTIAAKGLIQIRIEDGNRRQITISKEGVQNYPTGGVRNYTGGGVDLHGGGCETALGGVQNDTPLHNREYNRTSNRELNRDAHPRDGDFVEFEEVGVDQQPTNQPEPRKEKVAPKRKEVVMPWDSQLFREKWQLWKDYKKKEHRFGFKSEVSEQMALKKLTEVSNGQENRAIELIETAISNGWKGIHEVTQKNQTNGKQQPVTEKLARDIANDIANGGWNFAEGA